MRNSNVLKLDSRSLGYLPVLDHGSATVGFEQYQPVLECAKRLLPEHSKITLLADRGCEHSQLIHWLTQQKWSWAIRVKSNLQVQLANGCTQSVEQLIPPQQQVYRFENVQVLDGITAHLTTARVPTSTAPWAVLSNQLPSIQTFALYGKRFGGIEPTLSIECSSRHYDRRGAKRENLPLDYKPSRRYSEFKQ